MRRMTRFIVGKCDSSANSDSSADPTPLFVLLSCYANQECQTGTSRGLALSVSEDGQMVLKIETIEHGSPRATVAALFLSHHAVVWYCYHHATTLMHLREERGNERAG